MLLAVVTAALVVVGARYSGVIERYRLMFSVVLAGPFVVVALTRIWRWRSHKVHVTNLRVVFEGGVLAHYRTSVELRNVFATRVDQRVVERVTRRGLVTLETSGGSILVGKVRQPGALSRLIDAERTIRPDVTLPLDTIFRFEEPDPFAFEIRPRARRERRRDE